MCRCFVDRLCSRCASPARVFRRCSPNKRRTPLTLLRRCILTPPLAFDCCLWSLADIHSQPPMQTSHPLARRRRHQVASIVSPSRPVPADRRPMCRQDSNTTSPPFPNPVVPHPRCLRGSKGLGPAAAELPRLSRQACRDSVSRPLLYLLMLPKTWLLPEPRSLDLARGPRSRDKSRRCCP